MGDEFRVRLLAQEVVARAAVQVRLGERDDRVAQDEEVRPAAGALDRVGGVAPAVVEVRAGSGREVAARGETHDADALGVYVPFLGAGTDGAEGALSILQGR